MERDLEQLRSQCAPLDPRSSAQDACSGCNARSPEHQAACVPLCDKPSVCRPASGVGAGSPQESPASRRAGLTTLCSWCLSASMLG